MVYDVMRCSWLVDLRGTGKKELLNFLLWPPALCAP